MDQRPGSLIFKRDLSSGGCLRIVAMTPALEEKLREVRTTLYSCSVVWASSCSGGIFRDVLLLTDAAWWHVCLFINRPQIMLLKNLIFSQAAKKAKVVTEALVVTQLSLRRRQGK
jgi:hypothetical protein